MTQLKGKSYLQNKLYRVKSKVKTKYAYYEQENSKREDSPVIPKEVIRRYNSRLGWCTKAVDSLANRLVFDGFDNDQFALWEIFEYNNKDIFFDSAIRSALISSCCFIYISPDDDKYPRLQVIDGKNATGRIDPITNLLLEGYAILETDDNGQIITDVYFTPDYTEYQTNGKVTTVDNNTGYPLLVPIIYHPNAHKPFGQSRISRDMMLLQNKAEEIVTNMDVSAAFYSFPQKYLLGTAQDSDFDNVKATYSSFLEIPIDDDGNKPTAGQFTQAAMSPLVEQFHTYAKAFAGISGLTTDDLGFVSENPSSAESIKAGHGDLERLASKAQDTFGSGFLNVGLVAACLRDDFHYKRRALYETIPVWKPTFIMDNTALGSFGDAILKINQAIPNAISAKTIERLTGVPLNND